MNVDGAGALNAVICFVSAASVKEAVLEMAEVERGSDDGDDKDREYRERRLYLLRDAHLVWELEPTTGEGAMKALVVTG